MSKVQHSQGVRKGFHSSLVIVIGFVEICRLSPDPLSSGRQVGADLLRSTGNALYQTYMHESTPALMSEVAPIHVTLHSHTQS